MGHGLNHATRAFRVKLSHGQGQGGQPPALEGQVEPVPNRLLETGPEVAVDHGFHGRRRQRDRPEGEEGPLFFQQAAALL
jgi:hypothetical protein